MDGSCGDFVVKELAYLRIFKTIQGSEFSVFIPELIHVVSFLWNGYSWTEKYRLRRYSLFNL